MGYSRGTATATTECAHAHFTTQQGGMWNYDTCLDCGTNGPRYDVDLGLNDADPDAGGYFEEI
jgi:hypothetical protein